MNEHTATQINSDVSLDEPIISIKMPNKIESPLFTFKNVTQYLQISDATLYKLVEKNEIPCIRIRKKILFKKTSLDAFIDSCRKSNSRRETWPNFKSPN